MKKILLIVTGFLFVSLAGCGGDRNDVPPELLLGKDACDNCFMLINEQNFAASLRLKNGEAKRFDDIGCMLHFLKENENRTASIWVYDFLSGAPIEADKAFFAVSGDLVTPMGYGIAAFQSDESALEFAGKNKTGVISFKELKSTKLITSTE